MENKIVKTEEEWKKELSEEEYKILRKKATEAPFTGEYYKKFEDGTYKCAACGSMLFDSSHKFDSSCGWPSFDESIPDAVTYTEDNTLGMKRIEVTCFRCGGHLGHVFPDGPKETTSKRFCINSKSLKFQK